MDEAQSMRACLGDQPGFQGLKTQSYGFSSGRIVAFPILILMLSTSSSLFANFLASTLVQPGAKPHPNRAVSPASLNSFDNVNSSGPFPSRNSSQYGVSKAVLI